jgi:hypothetical protein
MGRTGEDVFVKIVELRNLDEARRYVAESLHFARAVPLTAPLVKDTLGHALSIVSNGEPLVPLGFIADFSHAIFESQTGHRRTEPPAVPGWSATAARAYEDYVLGKITADWSIERAADALRRYNDDERPRGLGYAIRQIRERAGLGGAELSPAVIRSLQTLTFDEVMRIGRESLATRSPHPLILEQYADMMSAFRRVAELLGPEDLAALEHRTAIAPLGQYVAHRQIVQTALQLESRMPAQRPLPRPGRYDVPTRVSDEDRYPVGGYASIGTKGSIESMLHSQLAYFEDGPQPDLFSMKYVRDELFYYTRDENQFLRPRKTLAILFDGSLVESRVKDAQAPVQRIVLVLSAVVVLVRKLVEWLTEEALRIELHFPAGPGNTPLADERELLNLLLRDDHERGIVRFESLPPEVMLPHFDALSRVSQLHILDVRAADGHSSLELDGVSFTSLTVPGPTPEWIDSTGDRHAADEGDVLDAWAGATMAIVREWV